MPGANDFTKQRANMQARNEAKYQASLQHALQAREQLRGKVPDALLEMPATSRQAKDEKRSRFFSGIPCKRGHISPRNTDLGCVQCRKEDRYNTPEKRAKATEKAKAAWADPEKRAKAKAAHKDYRQSEQGKEQNRRAAAKWREANREEARAAVGRAHRKRLPIDPVYRMRRNLQRRLNAVLRGKYKKDSTTMNLVGCTMDELTAHLEKQFTEGMSWDNYGEWHVDHIRPCASFDLSDQAQQKECFNWRNLQPLWGIENIKKRDQWEPS